MDPIELKTILIDQQRDKELINEEHIITREFQKYRRKLVDSKQVKVVFGVRRSGKSTTAHQLLASRKYAYVNFDDERLIWVSHEDLDNIFNISRNINENPEYILFDEIQNIHGWELFINRLFRKGLNIIITGSSANLLSSELSTHLTGRYLPIHMMPFSFREFLISRKEKVEDLELITSSVKARIRDLAEEYLRTGGFPLAVIEPDSARLYLKTLYDDIIGRDVIGRFHPKYTRTLREMALFLMNSSSKLMTYSSLRKRFKINSTHTAKNYCQFLVDASLIKIVEKFTFKQKERSASPKKVYAVDTGLVELFSTAPGDRLADLMENCVFLDLIRDQDLDPTISVNYWRDHQDHEVDLVVSRNRNVEKLIQVTYLSNINDLSRRETRSLVKGSNELRCDDLVLVTWDLEGEMDEKGKKIKMIPLWKWCLSR